VGFGISRHPVIVIAIVRLAIVVSIVAIIVPAIVTIVAIVIVIVIRHRRRTLTLIPVDRHRPTCVSPPAAIPEQ
jgi:hypothetical protein